MALRRRRDDASRAARGTVPPRIDRLVDTMRARRRYVEAYAAHVASHARPKRKKGASGNGGPRLSPSGRCPSSTTSRGICRRASACCFARSRTPGRDAKAPENPRRPPARPARRTTRARSRARGRMVRGMVCAIAIVDAERRRRLLRRGGRSGSRPRRGDVRGGLGAAPARVRRGRTRVRGVEGVRGCERRASDGDHRSDRRGVVRARRRRRRNFDDGAARERLWTPRGLAIVPPRKIGSPRDARGDRRARRRREARSRVGRETLDERLGTRARVHRRRRDRRGVVGRRRERGRERRRRRRRIRKYRGRGGGSVRGDVDGR